MTSVNKRSLGWAIAATVLVLGSAAYAEKDARIILQYSNCFIDGKELVYNIAKAKDVAECSIRCEKDEACSAFEIWEHTNNCKLYSALPKTPPRPQTFFPNNKLANNQQAQSVIGIKVRRGF